MRNLFWEGHKGGKLNHLVKQEIVKRAQEDGGLGLGDLKSRNLALLAKWGWRFFNEEKSLWCRVIRSIHDRSLYNWHTAGKVCHSLSSPWISISRSWLKVEALATYKLGSGNRIAFWHDPWLDHLPLKIRFPCLLKIALNPSGSVSNHWDSSSSSWSIFFRRLLKEEEILHFQTLISLISAQRVKECQDKRVWSLEPNGAFSVKSLVTHLSLASPLDKHLLKASWKSTSPRKVNITIQIMLCGYLFSMLG